MKNTALAGHVHLWRIQNDDKTGICKCGAVKEFIGARQFEILIAKKDHWRSVRGARRRLELHYGGEIT